MNNHQSPDRRVVFDAGHLDPLFYPRSIAIVGCSGDATRISGRPLKFLMESGYGGAVYPVNPKYDRIGGLRCYASIGEIDTRVDVALLMVPVARIETVFDDCVRAGVRAAVIFSSGYAEMGTAGKRIQERIRTLSLARRIPVLGPNCLGLINLVDNIPLSFSSVLEDKKLAAGDFALVSQSGAISAYILGVAHDAGIGFSHWVTTGNEAALDTFTIARYLLEKESVGGVVIYLEESRNPQEMMAAGRLAREKGKPLICLKVGRSLAGRRAAVSHTGALAGSDAEYSAAFRKAGIARAAHIESLLDQIVVLGTSPKPAGNRVVIMSISGGGGIICADRCEARGLSVPELGRQTRDRLAAVIPRFGSSQNPIDLTAELIASPGLLRQSIEIVLADPTVDAVVLFLGENRKNARTLSEDIAAVKNTNAHAAAKPIIVAWMAAPPAAVAILRKERVALLFDGVRAINALADLVAWHGGGDRDAMVGRARAKLNLPAAFELPACDPETLGELSPEKMQILFGAPKNEGSGQTVTLSEHTSKQALKQLGFSIPTGDLATTVDEALDIAEAIGYPVAAKLTASGIPHKSDYGAVKLGIDAPARLRQACAEMLAGSNRLPPESDIDGILVEKMLPPSIEAIVGLRWSQKFGSVLVVGLGGVFAEVFRDISLRLAPVDAAEALTMIGELKSARLFRGLRGSPSGDMAAVVETLVRLSRIGAMLGPRLVEMDINPLMVHRKGRGVSVADALIVLKARA